MGIKPDISIVIPVKNGAQTIAACLNAIAQQSIYERCEVLIIDSGSTDGTLDILKNFKIRLIQIPPEQFNHGATRNLGVQQARGEFVVMTVQDAVAANTHWLETLLGHFKDKAVAGVCGKQVVEPIKENNPHEWSRPQSIPRARQVQVESPEVFNSLSPAQQRDLCRWDDVNAMYRKTALLALPFEPLIYGEDMLWARSAILMGHILVYEPSAVVYHYHFQFPNYTYKRVLMNKVFTYTCFGLVTPPPALFKAALLILYRTLKWKIHPKWILHNIKIQYYSKKAANRFNKHLKSNTLEALLSELALEVPMGKLKRRS